jgi:hypothetical protein
VLFHPESGLVLPSQTINLTELAYGEVDA